MPTRRCDGALAILFIGILALASLVILRPGVGPSVAIQCKSRRHDDAPQQDLGLVPKVNEYQQLLERLQRHESILPSDALRRSVSYLGSSERLHRALAKLIRGEPVTIATIGGSVTAGTGAITQNLSYRERLFHWFRVTFPNDMLVLKNGAVAAATSSYVSQCINDYAPPESDIVFVEFTANDRQETCEYDIDGTRGYEVLLRKILQYPRAPAVVLVHWWSPLDQAFRESSEEYMELFAKYYGLPSLSWRDAMHTLLAANASGFTERDIYYDKLHPNGYNGHRYLADMIISFIRKEVAGMLLNGFESEWSNSSSIGPINKPILNGVHDSKKTSCLRSDALKIAVVSNDGWEWKNDGNEERPKWGFVSFNPGDKLVLKVNTLTYRGIGKIVTAIGTLKSYEHMGQAQLTCGPGCECEPRLLEGHWETRTSQTTWEYHRVSQSKDCHVTITNLQSTSNGEHKVSFNSFLVTDAHEDSMKWFASVSGQLEKAERYG